DRDGANNDAVKPRAGESVASVEREDPANEVNRRPGVCDKAARTHAAAGHVHRRTIQHVQATVVVERRAVEAEYSAVSLDVAGVVKGHALEGARSSAVALADGAGVVEGRL